MRRQPLWPDTVARGGGKKGRSGRIAAMVIARNTISQAGGLLT